jgi:hypothetical protein
LTTTTFMPAMTALAGLVPWADRDQADVAVRVAAVRWYARIDQEPGVLALAARVGLQAHRGRSR